MELRKNSFILLNQEKASSQNIDETVFINSYVPKTDRIFWGHSFAIGITVKDKRLQHFLPDPYIKVANEDYIGEHNPVIRLALRRPHFVRHGTRGIIVNNKILKFVNMAMQYQCRYKNFVGTVHECINVYLADRANTMKLPYEPVPLIDFTEVDDYVNNGKDIPFK